MPARRTNEGPSARLIPAGCASESPSAGPPARSARPRPVRRANDGPASRIGPGCVPVGLDRPSLARFEVALSSFAPKGQPQISPGQRPGHRDTGITRALKGRNRADRVAPFQGWADWDRCRSPGRCPGLFVGPLRGKTERRNFKTGASGWYRARPPRRGNPFVIRSRRLARRNGAIEPRSLIIGWSLGLWSVW